MCRKDKKNININNNIINNSSSINNNNNNSKNKKPLYCRTIISTKQMKSKSILKAFKHQEKLESLFLQNGLYDMHFVQ